MIGIKFLAFILFSTIIFSKVGLQAQKIDDKYPDIIHEAYYSNTNPQFKTFYGGLGKRYPIPVNPEKLLNDNNHWFVSLPQGSYITFQYTDNGIINAPNQDDIHIVENGCCKMARKEVNPEKAKIYVSHDGKHYVLLGEVNDCKPTNLDLADIGYNQIVHFIKIVGQDYKCNPEGFDLINAYPLKGSNVSLYIGLENAASFFSNATDNRILLLENIYFDNDSYAISSSGQKDLNLIVLYLKKYPKIKIHLSGHTDSHASESYNLKLSNHRAQAVKAFLIQNGVSAKRISAEGRGELFPLKSNLSPQGRAINRRVELRRLN